MDRSVAESEGVCLTPAAVARRLGVAPSTLRAWDRRYGLGPSAHEPGRHRRYAPADLAALEHMRELTSAGVAPAEAARVALMADRETPAQAVRHDNPQAESRPGGPGGRGELPLGRVRQECRGIARAAVRLDATEVRAQLRRAVDQYGLCTAWEEVILPALRASGRKWASSGDPYVAVEHLISWEVSSLLRTLTLAAPRPAPGPGALLACAGEEWHSLPIEALSAALAERGVPTLTLGAAVPPDSLLHALEKAGPFAVVLWAQRQTPATREILPLLTGKGWGGRGARVHARLFPWGPGWGRGSGGPHSLTTAVERVLAVRPPV